MPPTTPGTGSVCSTKATSDQGCATGAPKRPAMASTLPCGSACGETSVSGCQAAVRPLQVLRVEGGPGQDRRVSAGAVTARGVVLLLVVILFDVDRPNVVARPRDDVLHGQHG